MMIVPSTRTACAHAYISRQIKIILTGIVLHVTCCTRLCAVMTSSSSRLRFLPLSFIGDLCSDEGDALGGGGGSVEEPDAATG